jgi:hypothetical protein
MPHGCVTLGDQLGLSAHRLPLPLRNALEGALPIEGTKAQLWFCASL